MKTGRFFHCEKSRFLLYFGNIPEKFLSIGCLEFLKNNARIAQLVEHITDTDGVLGSNPSTRTIKNDFFICSKQFINNLSTVYKDSLKPLNKGVF